MTVKGENVKKLEIIGTMLLSVASVAVAWCSYQSTLWNGEQVFRLAESNLYYRRSQAELMKVSQQQVVDAAITINFMEAVVEKRRTRVNYYHDRKDQSQLLTILDKWLTMNPLQNDKAPVTPLQMGEYKHLIKSSLAPSDSSNTTAEGLWKESEYNNSVSDKYILCTVIFSIVMFLAAMATKLSNMRLAFGFMMFAYTIFFTALVLLLLLMPIEGIP